MGRSAKAIKPDPSTVTCNANRPPANKARSHQGRRGHVVSLVRKNNGVSGISEHVRRIPSIARVPSKDRIIAEILTSVAAEFTRSAGLAEPWNSNALANGKHRAWSQRIDVPDDFVARHDWQHSKRQISINDVEIGAANSACADPDPHLIWAGDGGCTRHHDERCAWLPEFHGLHCGTLHNKSAQPDIEKWPKISIYPKTAPILDFRQPYPTGRGMM